MRIGTKDEPVYVDEADITDRDALQAVALVGRSDQINATDIIDCLRESGFFEEGSY